jgi:hypothetical protein
VISADGTFNGPFTYAMTGTAGAVPSMTNPNFITYTLPASKLVAGQNIIAVEVHQTTLSSSDLLIDCDLVTTPPAPPLALNFSHDANAPLLWWLDSAAYLESSTDLQTWTPVPITGSPFTFTPNAAARFWRLHKP